MCGIAGIINITGHRAAPSVKLLRGMVSALKHRGPDEFGLYRDSYAGLVHARLSIIDVISGQQPLSNEDDSTWIVFNGEIFNYVELRHELENLGHSFRTRSDTEVIVHAYETWGRDCFRRFNGQWAVALWDSVRRRLVVSRDRIGICPLYLHSSGGQVRFASEVKALFADPSVRRCIDPKGLDQTFTYWTSVAPQTVFEGIEEVRPGSVREFDSDGSSHEWTYWTLSYPEATLQDYPLTVSEAAEALEEKLEKATTLRMLRSDVPVGCYLSGGLDSSLTAWMSRKTKQGDFRTFSIRFAEAEFDETAYQREMVSSLDSTHEDLVVRRADIADVFPAVVAHAERPILRTAPAPLYMLSRLVRDSGTKAVVTGEGADEILAGYDIFREGKIREFWARQPRSLWRPRLFERLYPYLARSPQQARGMALQFWGRGLDRVNEPGFSHEPRWWTTSTIKKFYSKPIAETVAADPPARIVDQLPPGFQGWDSLAKAQYLEVVTLLSGYLISSQGDRMLMAHSVEGRFPFLDPEVIDFCSTLPASYKLAGLDEKFILKKVARGKLPDKILHRPKQPYRAPDAICFLGREVPDYVAALLSPESVSTAGLFDAKTVAALYAKCSRHVNCGDNSLGLCNADNMAFLGILSTMILHDQFIQYSSPAGEADVWFATFVDRTLQPA